MISPEILRKFPYFYGFSDTQLRELAMNAEAVETTKGNNVFEEGQSAEKFYLLVDGSIDLYVKSEEEYDPASRRDFSVGEVNPGETFGFSALWEPYRFQLTAKAAQNSQLIEFDGSGLSEIMKTDKEFAYTFMEHAAKALMERLSYTRIQLAAAWAA
jgi:CRP/FNR family transcriptional regulator, cyclic AMP receptor protein